MQNDVLLAYGRLRTCLSLSTSVARSDTHDSPEYLRQLEKPG
jgi:hypothetical protein